MPEGTKFVTLDGVERTLTDRDLMICNTEEAMCIGGVFGGLDSGVTEQTTDIFLESACFHPTWIRKDSPSLRFEHRRFFPLRAWFGSEQYDVCIETCRSVDPESSRW